MTTFILADNQDLTRIGLETIIRATFIGYPLAIVDDSDHLRKVLDSAETSVILLHPEDFDFSLPEDLEALHHRYPTSHFILIGNDFDDALLHQVSSLHYVSILLKTNCREEYKAALKCSLRQERYLCHQVINRLIGVATPAENGDVLTQAESEILRLIALGKTVKEIASMRISSTHTIVSHKKNIFRKIGVNNVHDATRYALKKGLIDIDYYI